MVPPCCPSCEGCPGLGVYRGGDDAGHGGLRNEGHGEYAGTGIVAAGETAGGATPTGWCLSGDGREAKEHRGPAAGVGGFRRPGNGEPCIRHMCMGAALPQGLRSHPTVAIILRDVAFVAPRGSPRSRSGTVYPTDAKSYDRHLARTPLGCECGSRIGSRVVIATLDPIRNPHVGGRRPREGPAVARDRPVMTGSRHYHHGM